MNAKTINMQPIDHVISSSLFINKGRLLAESARWNPAWRVENITLALHQACVFKQTCYTANSTGNPILPISSLFFLPVVTQ